MNNSPFASDIYQPQQDGGQTGELFPDQGDEFDGPTDDQMLDSGYSPPERPLALGRFGQTNAEERQGETIEQRCRQEEPEYYGADVDDRDEFGDRYEPGIGGPRAGRIVMGANDMEGTDVGIDGGAASAEEAAMHLVVED